MATRSIFFMLKKYSFLLSVLVISACAEVENRHEVNPFNPTPKAEQKNQFGNNETAPPQAIPVAKEKHVAVILGPGGYKAFAHAGVLKELKKANIPIQRIVGVEWGALVAGLFAQRGQVHEAEWK